MGIWVLCNYPLGFPCFAIKIAHTPHRPVRYGCQQHDVPLLLRKHIRKSRPPNSSNGGPPIPKRRSAHQPRQNPSEDDKKCSPARSSIDDGTAERMRTASSHVIPHPLRYKNGSTSLSNHPQGPQCRRAGRGILPSGSRPRLIRWTSSTQS